MNSPPSQPPTSSATDKERVGGARVSKRARWLAAIALVFSLVVLDTMRPPERQWTTAALLSAIDLYQATLSRAMPSMGVKCRFHPTCSRYTEEAVRRHGWWKGTRLGAWRILRCGPWTEAGTVEHPPE